MDIIRRESLPELMSLRQAMDKLFEGSFVHPYRFLTASGETAAPALDVYQTPDEVVVKAALPEVKPEDINIDITSNTLTINVETKIEKEAENKKENYLYQERRYGTFSRSLVLPNSLQTDKAEADMESGILTLTIPKTEEVKPKTIKVKIKERQ